MTPLWFSTAYGAIAISLFGGIVHGQAGLRQAVSPGYAGRDACPSRCSVSGPDSSNWPVYHNFDQFQSCPQTLFYTFNLHDDVDDATTYHRIYTCSSYGPDWVNLPKSTTDAAPVESVSEATYSIGWWSEGGRLAIDNINALSRQLRDYLMNGYGETNKTTMLFAQSGIATVGLYIGQGLQNEGLGSSALNILENNLAFMSVTSSSMAIQLCEPGYGNDHIFGLMATSNGTFGPLQNALKSWANAECLTFTESKNFTGPVHFATPLAASTNSTVHGTNSTTSTVGSKTARLSARADCRTTQVQAGDDCGKLAVRCGISGADFTKYNSASGLCSSLKPLQHVCCSSGTLPDFRPKPEPDGSCHTYKIQDSDTCSTLAAAYGLSTNDIDHFNEKTWGWNGCSNVIWSGIIVCLSSGTPPMPLPVANAICGPQVPGTKAPTDGSDIAKLNPCPLNACCDVFGQCGITAEFCTPSGSGAPGTAKPGTNGCISNCGTTIVRGDAPAVFRKIGYFEGYSFTSRDCLYQDALQIDSLQYTHLHFAFGAITADYQVNTGDTATTYEFMNFRRIQGPKKILSFGGWDFSTMPSTYNIFRQGVTPANRLKLATNIANFIKDNNLDGVDIDWEYPSAPDIPNIPPGSKEEGLNYVAFLVILKNLLPGKSVSIAAPASYWYLKGFPIKQISQIVDYIVFMTYDLHGQWDASNQYSQIGCPSGMCLRSGVNLSETVGSLVMITKAGVPSNKVVVGVTSYGRSFAMAQPGCHTPECLYTGSPLKSNAAKGRCTGTAGYIANAEIQDIISNSSRVTEHYVDAASNTNILVYDNIQWVSYMSPETRTSRTAIYKNLNMGGTTNWAIDLETYNDPPLHSNSWSDFVVNLKLGWDKWQPGERSGNWTSVPCNDQSVEDWRNLTPSQRWNMMGCPDAWKDAIDNWKKVDAGKTNFMASVSDTFHGPELALCGEVSVKSSCVATFVCKDFEVVGSGPAAYQIWISLVQVHELYVAYYNAIFEAAASEIDNSLKDFENKFAPVPSPPDDKWVFFLIDLVTLGAGMIAGPFFNSFLTKLPYFLAHGETLDNLKDTSMTIISQSTTIAKDLYSSKSPDQWTPGKQDEFSTYMGHAIGEWANITAVSLRRLFSGNDDGIDMLTALISDGKFIQGAGYSAPNAKDTSDSDLRASIAKAFFAIAIPSIWTVSLNYPFIIDSGYDCGTIDPLDQYLDKDTMQATYGCVDGKLYYLASPKGASQNCPGCLECDRTCTNNYFSAPPGIDSLDGKTFGGITVSDLITGSVRTYKQNGNTNGAGAPDPTDKATLESLYSQDITTPGFIRLPVCSPEMAFLAWDSGASSLPNYPCVQPPGLGDCGASTIEDQTSGASPTVDDCLRIVKDLQATGANHEWEVENAIGAQHQLVGFGSCNFGVQGKGKKGNIDFYIGAQDVIDLINDSVKQFGSSGKVGSKGSMACRGDTITSQQVEWGLY